MHRQRCVTLLLQQRPHILLPQRVHRSQHPRPQRVAVARAKGRLHLRSKKQGRAGGGGEERSSAVSCLQGGARQGGAKHRQGVANKGQGSWRLLAARYVIFSPACSLLHMHLGFVCSLIVHACYDLPVVQIRGAAARLAPSAPARG